MSVFSVYAPVKRENYNVNPFVVHKDYTINSSSFSSRGYVFHEGRYYRIITPVSSSKALNDPKNSDGTYMHISYKSVKHAYYNEEKSPYLNLELPDYENLDRRLHLTSSAVYFPYYDYGEGIQRETVILSDLDNNIVLRDDGFGNLYDTSIDTSSFPSFGNIILDLTFDSLVDNTKSGTGPLGSCSVSYNSSNHTPEYKASIVNATLDYGPLIDSSSFGSSLYMSSSYVHLKNNQYVSYDREDDFSVSFWMKTTVSSSLPYQYLISKRGTLESLKYGSYVDYNDAGENRNRRGLYPVVEDVLTNVYPLSFKYITSGSDFGKVVFERSDGSTTITMTTSGSVSDGEYHHVVLSKSGSSLYLYLDGNLESSGSDLSGEVFNYHDYVIGSLNRSRDYAYNGNLFDVKFYDVSLDSTEVSAISTTSSIAIRQSSYVGNVFYKTGALCITSPLKKYHDILHNNYQLYYKNTVTHYEIETVCVIDKEKFNYTLNPSSLSNYKNGIYKQELISGSLNPYITTVGLYNQNNDLVAIGKLASPLKKRDDVDLNIIVKLDY